MRSSEIPLNRLYGDLSFLWPFISEPAEYVAEASHWQSLLVEKFGDRRLRLLELGVGGGHNLSHFATKHEVTAVDLSAKMIEHAKLLNPSVEFLTGDMRTVRLGKRFDAVLIHDAICYMTTESDILSTLATAREHLNHGGVLIMSPDHFKETFENRPVYSTTRSIGSTEVTYLEYHHDPDPNDSTTEIIMIFMIRDSEGLRIELDRHITGLLSVETWKTLMRSAGFVPELRQFELGEEETKYSMLVGVLE